MNICVFASSSENLAPHYQKAAIELGTAMGKAGHNLVYGGSRRGLMGIVSRACQESGGKTTGVIPLRFQDAAEGEDELIVVKDFPERTAKMKELSNAFVSLAGGFGTLYEISDVIQSGQFNEHTKPLVLLNTNGFYKEFQKYLKRIVDEGFAPADNHGLWHLAGNVPHALQYIDNYVPSKKKDKV